MNLRCDQSCEILEKADLKIKPAKGKIIALINNNYQLCDGEQQLNYLVLTHGHR
jgi:hypothetical protein